MDEQRAQDQIGSSNGPGDILRAAREEKNLRPEDIAYEIRLTPTQVRALEDNDYSRMPEETYVRGYLRNYARLVGIPENDILVSFARFTRTTEAKTQPALMPVAEDDNKKSSKNVLLIAFAGIAAVIVLSAVWVLKPNDESADAVNETVTVAVAKQTEPTAVPVGASTLDLAKSSAEPAIDNSNSSTDPAASTTETSSVVQTETDTPQIATTVTITPELKQTEIPESENIIVPGTLTGAAETLTSPDVATDGLLLVSYIKDSWTDIRDSNGKKLFYRTGKKGEKITLNGVPPLSLFFGFAQGVEVTYNGVEIDVSSHTRGVFARFTLGDLANP